MSAAGTPRRQGALLQVRAVREAFLELVADIGHAPDPNDLGRIVMMTVPVALRYLLVVVVQRRVGQSVRQMVAVTD